MKKLYFFASITVMLLHAGTEETAFTPLWKEVINQDFINTLSGGNVTAPTKALPAVQPTQQAAEKSESEEEESDSTPARKTFTCTHPGCTREFFNRISLTGHANEHSGARWTCNRCNFQSLHRTSADTHRRTKPGHKVALLSAQELLKSEQQQNQTIVKQVATRKRTPAATQPEAPAPKRRQPVTRQQQPAPAPTVHPQQTMPIVAAAPTTTAHSLFTAIATAAVKENNPQFLVEFARLLGQK